MTKTNTTRAVNEKLQELTTSQLIEAFVMTGKNNDSNIPTVRGWIMDELERRNAEAFNAWLDSDDCEDEDLKKYFNC